MTAQLADNYTDSIHYLEIMDWFGKISPPYGLREIRTFNAMYQRLYPIMNAREKRRVEDEIVDALIRHAETPNLRNKIFGVV